jgi:formylglycine-generating enzyme required for sulfatase activity
LEPYLLFQKAVPGDYTKDVLAIRDIYGWARTIAAKHLLIILDSCFSGLVAEKPGPSDIAAGLSNALAGEPSGLLLTAGTGDEAAYAVHYSKEKNGSIFTRALIDALRNLSRSEGIITIGEAFERSKVSVAAFDAVENRKMTPLSIPLVRRNGIGEGNFVFVNTQAQNPPLPSGLYGRGASIIKAPDTVDANLHLIQLEYEEVKSSDDLPALRAFVESYKGRPFGQTLVGLIEARINRIEDLSTAVDRLPGIGITGIAVPPSPQTRRPGESRISNSDGLSYRWIPPTPPEGFLMGCSPGDLRCRPDETPHTVRLTKGFWLGETEVTQAAYNNVMHDNPSNYFKGLDLPVQSVTWSQATAYCEVTGGRLPTETEWEWAARAGTKVATYGDPDKIGWLGGSQGPHPVGKKEPNAWGLRDMLGNVGEWVSDWYAMYPTGKVVVDPTGPTPPQKDAQGKVVRGGDFADYNLRVSGRSYQNPNSGVQLVGFRCVGE